jgi:hypothetical protein
MRTKKEAIGRLLKVASNQMSREFDNFAAQLDLTGQQNVNIRFFLEIRVKKTQEKKSVRR